MKSVCVSLLMFFCSAGMIGQTVGLLQNSPESFNGYTLFAPSGYEHTYLIDNCGRLVNEWTSDFTPGQSAYLLENGDLLRAARISSSFNAGGSGGRIERLSWNDELVWRVNYSTANYHQHHDIEPLPNGNILVIAWEKRTEQEAIDAGRDPALLNASGVWPECIVELQPLGTDDFSVAWEWHLWDHLIQDFDSTRLNFGLVADHPELVDFNFIGDNGSGADWIHLNSIDYNPHMDQILVSSRHLNEIWVIDHSTTSEEAAGHSGGSSGKGGDLLYRWGNPEVYRRGSPNTQSLYGQHNAHWVDPDLQDSSHIMVYNNGFGRPEGTYSSIDIFTPPLDSNGVYIFGTNEPFGPDSVNWTFDGLPDNSFFSSRISSGQRLPNGNTLICVGTRGYFFEIDTDGQIVWQYQNPVGINGPVAQGESPVLDDVFQVLRYSPNYEAFNGKELTAGAPVELNPWPNDCEIFQDTTTSSVDLISLESPPTYPNPFGTCLVLQNDRNKYEYIKIFNISGVVMFQAKLTVTQHRIYTENWPDGLYIVQYSTNDNKFYSLKLIKQ